MADLTTTFGTDRSLTTKTPAPQQGATFLQGLNPDLLARLIASKTQPQPAAAPAVQFARQMPQIPQYQPQLGGGSAAADAALRQQALRPKPIERYSYNFNDRPWAGSAPILPTFVGYGKEGRDFILDGKR